MTDIVDVGPIVAAMVIGYTGTAPIEMSCGPRVIHRLSRRGNRQLNHAMHLAALSRIRYPDTPGRVNFDHKIARARRARKRSGR